MPDAPPAALRPVPVPSAALLARLAPLTPVPGRPDLVAHYAPDVFALWQAWEEECGAPQAVPFWAAVWPAGQLLARVVQAEPAWVRGQTVLDLGCGSGVAGIAALRAGATRVVAHDIDLTDDLGTGPGPGGWNRITSSCGQTGLVVSVRDRTMPFRLSAGGYGEVDEDVVG